MARSSASQEPMARALAEIENQHGLWLGLSHVAGNPRVDSETFQLVLQLNLDESNESYLEGRLSILCMIRSAH